MSETTDLAQLLIIEDILYKLGLVPFPFEGLMRL